MTTQNKRRDKTEHERRREGRRVDDGAKKHRTEEMHEEDERVRKGEMRERMTAGVKRERKKREETGERE